jgi:hypothetical protein
LSFSSSAAVIEVPVEVLDAGPRWSYGSLAANFARVQILVAWYGGEPDRYLDAIANGTEDAEDVDFVRHIQERLKVDPSLLADMRRIVAEFARHFPASS